MATFTLLVVLPLMGVGMCCLVVPGYQFKDYTMEQTLYKAPIVIYGKDILHNDTFDTSPGNYAVFEVFCILKNTDKNAMRVHQNSSQVTIQEGAMRDSCQGTELKVGISYILPLEYLADSDTPGFYIYEPEINYNSSFESTERTLKSVTGICGLQGGTVVSQDTNPDDCDPDPVTEAASKCTSCPVPVSGECSSSVNLVHSTCNILLLLAVFSMIYL